MKTMISNFGGSVLSREQMKKVKGGVGNEDQEPGGTCCTAYCTSSSECRDQSCTPASTTICNYCRNNSCQA
jgi:hypothetical protein